MIYTGLSGRTYVLEEKRIGSGGEGIIYRVIDDNTIVAKIYKENKRDIYREEKLKAMVCRNLSKDQTRYVTWPLDVLYEEDKFVGYIMQKVEHSQPLISVYSEEKYDLRTRLLTAINLCIAIESIHELGQVCGDLNPQNICVNLNQYDTKDRFKVTLVDTDSYHFSTGEKTYRCEVGMAEYLAPEIQKKVTGGYSLVTAPLPTYTKESDLFALAVHIFLLLMNGCHPFACAKESNNGMEENIQQINANSKVNSGTTPQPIDNIKDGFFPFVNYRQGIRIPIYAPEFNTLPESVRKLFIRTFIDGYIEPQKRVKPAEWIDTLKPLITDIKQCQVGHYYFGNNNECTMCSVKRKIAEEFGLKYNPEAEKEKNEEIKENRDYTSNVPPYVEKPSYPTEKKGWFARCREVNGTPATIMLIITLIIVAFLALAMGSAIYDEYTHQKNYSSYSYDDSTDDYNTDDSYETTSENETIAPSSQGKVIQQIRDDIQYDMDIEDYKTTASKLYKLYQKYVEDEESITYSEDDWILLMYDTGGVFFYEGDVEDKKAQGEGKYIYVDDKGKYKVVSGAFKDGTLNGKCKEYNPYAKFFDGEKYKSVISGTYTDGDENGKFSEKVTYTDGKVETYYWTSKNGDRQIKYKNDDGNYVYAETADKEHYMYYDTKKEASGYGIYWMISVY